MFDSARTSPRLSPRPRKTGQPDPAAKLKARCLSSASLWVLKRRAKRPWLGPQRLPSVARTG